MEGHEAVSAIQSRRSAAFGFWESVLHGLDMQDAGGICTEYCSRPSMGRTGVDWVIINMLEWRPLFQPRRLLVDTIDTGRCLQSPRRHTNTSRSCDRPHTACTPEAQHLGPDAQHLQWM